MALRVHLHSPKILPQTLKSQTHQFPSTTLQTRTPKIQISCTNSTNDAELASDLATEVQKMKTHLVLREEAMKKSRQILFTELCQHMGLDSEEVKKTWKRMREEDKWVLAKGFVSDWGDNFHPLSARSVKEMVDQHLVEENPSLSSSNSMFFPNLKKIMGFSENQ